MPSKVCLALGCPRPATRRGRCRVHAGEHDRTIDRTGRNIYGTKRWKYLRQRKLFINPICEDPDCSEIATDVHHKHGVENDPWSLAGLESLCHSCHSRLTRATQLTT